MFIFCSKCGTQNDDNNLKCSKCGNIIQQMPQPTIPAKRKKIVRIVLVAILGVIILYFIVGTFFIVPFVGYWERSYDSAAQDNLRNASTAQEAYFVDNETYTDSLEKLVGDYDLFINEGITLQIVSAGKDQYHMIAYHKKGKKKYQIIGPGGTISFDARKQ